MNIFLHPSSFQIFPNVIKFTSCCWWGNGDPDELFWFHKNGCCWWGGGGNELWWFQYVGNDENIGNGAWLTTRCIRLFFSAAHSFSINNAISLISFKLEEESLRWYKNAFIHLTWFLQNLRSERENKERLASTYWLCTFSSNKSVCNPLEWWCTIRYWSRTELSLHRLENRKKIETCCQFNNSIKNLLKFMSELSWMFGGSDFWISELFCCDSIPIYSREDGRWKHLDKISICWQTFLLVKIVKNR